MTSRGLAVGRNLHLGLTEADGDPIISHEWSPSESDGITITFGAVLAEGVSYQLYVFYDLDDDGVCGANDRRWRTQVGPVAGAVTVDLGALSQEPATCSYFAP